MLTLITALKKQGHKITPVRKALLNAFNQSKQPVSARELQHRLKRRHLTPNKTTVYREIEFLLEQAMIKPVEFGDGKKRYELRQQKHHHHAVCTRCKNTADIELSFSVCSQNIIQGFKVKRHSMEFFGLCRNCQNK